MTNEQETALRNFEALVRQLMRAYDNVRKEKAALAEQLAASEQRLSETKGELEQLRKAYHNLKTARIMEVSGDDVKETRARIAKLIRDVDKCIALLDV